MKCGHHAARAYVLKSHGCDLNSDTMHMTFSSNSKVSNSVLKHNSDKKILRFKKMYVCRKFWHGIALRCRNGPPMAHLWNSWGERLLLWQCLFIWGALFTPKAKHPGAEWWACLATPRRLPRIMAGRQRTLDQDSPLHKYRQGRGSSGELTQGFHPKEAHFRGMCPFLPLHRSPPSALCG